MTLLLIASAIPLAANLSSTHRTLVIHARGPTRLGFVLFGIMLRAHAATGWVSVSRAGWHSRDSQLGEADGSLGKSLNSFLRFR